MDIKIIETGETEELNIIDPKSGANWINDLMGNHDALPELEEDEDGYETGYHLMTQEDFDWWKNLTEEYQKADNRFNELLKTVSNDKYEELQSDAHNINVDLEDFPAALNNVCDYYDRSPKGLNHGR